MQKSVATPREVRNYAAITGSASVAVSGLFSLLFPQPWDLVVWVVLAFVLCTLSGLSITRFLE